ncbi:MAG: type restriction enzyme subunit [Actinomycetota bacterium]|nr:type restriction enzyme subunit [Actinomycetota bacterium]
MSPVYDEAAFGDAVFASMRERGWRVGEPGDYRADVCVDTRQLLTFLGATQADAWRDLVARYGGDADAAQSGFVRRLDQAITVDGILDVLRKGVKDHGVTLRLAYFRPSLVLDDAILDDYRANRLTVVRELPYATRPTDQGHRLDLTLFLNGLPVATAELKNPLTGQGVEQAIAQYRSDRDPSEPIFRRRVVANFAVDPDRVFVTTALRGERTRFLPFNTGSAGPGNPGGAGNPPARAPGTYPASYLWEQIWRPDTWLDLLERFVHQRRVPGPGRGTLPELIFPRYHQWHAVTALTEHAARHGAGHHYLVMASAGSGKSNTIAWLAHRLASLHAPTDPADLDPAAATAGLRPGSLVFDKILVITDRRNLDAQLRDTVGSFERTAGLVVKIDDRQGAKSEQLAQVLSRESGKIVTVTLHTFPALVDYLRREPTEIRGRRFAIVLDEAHSSQSGDAAVSVRAVLRDLGLDADDDTPGATSLAPGDAAAPGPGADGGPSDRARRLADRAALRQRAGNLSYFAFTATPKAKTLELFGTPDGGGAYRPFHTYSMRQAIEEGFILDPLRTYVTYATYYKLVNRNSEDRVVDPGRAGPLLARYARLHPSTVAQHAEVIIGHFRAHTAGRLGGRAKAMVVTSSRRSAVDTARALRQHVRDRGYPDPGVLVAFSGTLTYDGQEITESSENGGLSESGLPKAFAYTRADDPAAGSDGRGQPEYRILVVAEKYQTGFDQPLLTTMYVNKKLAGVSAVQTLSRLNRTAERKTQGDLAILDFVNDAEDIRAAFLPYHERAETLPTDANLLYTAQSRVLRPRVLVDSEMDGFVDALLAAEERAPGARKGSAGLHAELYRHLEPAVTRFTDLLDADEEADREAAEDFRADLGDYTRKYAFLSQIIPYTDAELESLYVYGRHLLTRLPRRTDLGIDLGDLDLSHLRVERTGVLDLGLRPEGTVELPGFGTGTGGAPDPERSPLSELIERFNDQYGTQFTQDDIIRPFTEAMNDPKVRRAAVANNDEENFGHVFEPVFEKKMMDHVDTVAELGREYFKQGGEVQTSLNRSARRAAWRMIRDAEGVNDDAV